MSERPPAQIEAVRRDGAQSHGPITEKGKAISSQNAVTHGLLATSVVIKGESHEKFQELLDSLVIEWLPFNFDEYALIEGMAVARWRQMRAWSLTTAGHNYMIRGQEEANPDIASLDMPTRAWHALCQPNATEMNRHEIRYGREYLRYRKELVTAQDKRKKGEQK